jgi:hypothetical protein
MAKKSNRTSGPGRNFSSDIMNAARDRPIVTAAAAAAAVGAGVFLWSRRNQISDQISQLSDQISEWTENFRADDDTGGFAEADETEGTLATTVAQGSRRSTGGRSTTRGMSETGGGNASLGARSGGAGTTGSLSGRGRARSTPTT